VAETVEVLIIDENNDTRQSLKEMLGANPGIEVIGEARDGKEALNRLSIISPSIVVMSVSEEVSESIKDLEAIVLRYPTVGVIVLSQHRDWYYVRQYMRAGAKDYLYMPVTQDILIATIEDVYRMDKEIHRRNSEAFRMGQDVHPVKIVSFVSSKGGVGRTTLAVNTAVALAASGKKTVLADFDLQSGVVSLCLNLKPSRTLTDLVHEMVEIDPDLLERYLSSHESGLRVLPAPRHPEEMELIRPADIRVVLQSLQKNYDFIVIDTSAVINDLLLTILELSNDILLVTTPSLPALHNNRELMNLMIELNYNTAKVHQIVNRATLKHGVTVKDVADTFSTDIYWQLDDDAGLVERAANEGIPFVTSAQRHRLARQIQDLAHRLQEQSAPETTGKPAAPKLKKRHRQ